MKSRSATPNHPEDSFNAFAPSMCCLCIWADTPLHTQTKSESNIVREPSQGLSDGLKLRAEPFNRCSSAVPLHMVFRWGNWKKAPRIGHYSEWESLRGGKKKKKDRDPSSLGHMVQQRACVCIMCLICTYECTNLIHIRATVTSHTPTIK